MLSRPKYISATRSKLPCRGARAAPLDRPAFQREPTGDPAVLALAGTWGGWARTRPRSCHSCGGVVAGPVLMLLAG